MRNFGRKLSERVHPARRTICRMPSDPKPYQALFKYWPIDTALISLRSGTMRWRSPLDFNDPLDSQWDPGWAIRTPEFAAAFIKHGREVFGGDIDWSRIDPVMHSQIRKVRERFATLPPAERVRAIEKELESTVRYFRDKEAPTPPGLRRMRLLCMSLEPHSMLMWSHYADQHRGVVLSFDVNILRQAYGVPAQIRYASEVPQLVSVEAWIQTFLYKAGVVDLTPEQVAIIWQTKGKQWEYEKEYRYGRMVAPETTSLHDDFPFPREALKGVFLGCRTSPEHETTLKEVLATYPEEVGVVRLRRSMTKFEVTGYEPWMLPLDYTPAGGIQRREL